MVGDLRAGAGRASGRFLAADPGDNSAFGFVHAIQHQMLGRRQETPHNINRLPHKPNISTLSTCTESAEEPISVQGTNGAARRPHEKSGKPKRFSGSIATFTSLCLDLPITERYYRTGLAR